MTRPHSADLARLLFTGLLRTTEVMQPDHQCAVVLGQQRPTGVDANLGGRYELAGTAVLLEVEDREGEVEAISRLGVGQSPADEEHRFGGQHGDETPGASG